jgi:hypothetical protein
MVEWSVRYANRKALFRGMGTLPDLFQKTETEIKNSLARYPVEKLIRVDEDECVRYLVDKYSMQAPEIDESRILQEEPVEHYSYRGDLLGRVYVFVVPYVGDANLFQYQAATNLPVIFAVVTEQFIKLYYFFNEPSRELARLPNRFANELDQIKESLKWTKKVVDRFNINLEPFVRQLVVRRKETREKTLAAAEATGVKIRRRQDLAKPYKVLVSPKKKAKPLVLAANEEMHWTLVEDSYEDILDIVRSMSMLMEKSPKTFAKLKEEEIRDHFLMLLNIYFEGQVTGETFNYKGRTDILIRVHDKNVFIAECKFWRYPKALVNAIDQLFRYVDWRDTKTAIILFHKQGDFTSVKDKIPGIMLSHPNFIREHKLSKAALAENETISSYILHHPTDEQREIIVTTMGFNIPR